MPCFTCFNGDIPFTIPNIVISEIINKETGEFIEGRISESDSVSFDIFIPYYENAKEIVIYDENDNELVREDVSFYSSPEYYNSIDLFEKQVGEVVEDETIESEKREISIEGINKYWWILVVIVFILLIIFIFPRKRK